MIRRRWRRAGLRWLADGGARVPRVLDETPGRLVLERIETGTLSSAGEEVHPFADGWRARIPLWQLFPLLVHAVLFGGSYVTRARELAVRLAR